MPIAAVDNRTPSPPPTPAPQPPWSWTVAELGPHLTESQRQTVLGRLRAIGFDVHAWTNPEGTP
jgi:hypothetical protein